jgi:hypothetical protein
MSTLAELNAAIAAYQQSQAAINTEMVEAEIKRTALAEATTTGQANVDAALAAQDAAVGAAQAELDAAYAQVSAVANAQSLTYSAVIEALLSYVPE